MMTTGANRTSRRAVLGALAAIPAVAIPTTATAQAVDRSAWDAAFATYQRTSVAADAADARHEAAQGRFEAMRPSLDMIQWRELGTGEQRTVSNALGMDVEARWQWIIEQEGKLWWARDPEATKARHRAALDSVLEYRRLHEQAREQSGLKACFEDCWACDEAFSAADTALMRTPAPDGEALLWKLEDLFGEELETDNYSASYSPDTIGAVMADARRLLGRA